MSEAAPPRSPPSQPPRLLFASHLLIPLKVSRSDHPTSPAMRRSWHHRRLAALAHDQLPKKHIATSTAVQRRSVNQGNAVNTTCKLLRCPPSTERATQTTQSRSPVQTPAMPLVLQLPSENCCRQSPVLLMPAQRSSTLVLLANAAREAGLRCCEAVRRPRAQHPGGRLRSRIALAVRRLPTPANAGRREGRGVAARHARCHR